jgi:RecA-family ATPase
MIEDNFDFGCDPDVEQKSGYQQKETKQFVWFNEHDLMNMPPAIFLVDRYMVENVTTLLYGAQRTMKSFWCLDMALSITYGVPFQGCAVQQGAVAYICGEGLAGIGKRVAAWRKHRCLDATASSPFYTLNRAVRLLDGEEIGGLIRDLNRMERDYNFKFRLIIIDTLSKSLHGEKEDEVGIGKALAHADLMREATNANVLLVHHAGKTATQGARGSSLLGCNCDAVYCMEREDNCSDVFLAAEKLKDTEDGWKVEFRAKEIVLDDGRNSLVLEYQNEWSGEELSDKARQEKQAQKDDKKEQKILENRFNLAAVLERSKRYSMEAVCTKMNKAKGGYYAVIRAAVPEGRDNRVEVKHRAGNIVMWRDRTDEGEFVVLE